MKRFAITILLFVLVVTISLAVLSYKVIGRDLTTAHAPAKGNSNKLVSPLVKKLSLKASAAKAFAVKNNFTTDFCFLIDMSLPSYQRRFFIYDVQKDTILNSGLVTHGNCNQYWLEGRKYGNAIGCGCTSLGKYKIGYSYTGRFGLAFKLYGLENTNRNAFARYVVLHSHSCVPENEIETDICQSNGCPTVAPGFLKTLEPIIKGAKKPVLLWIFN
jgi:hypothetical protein